MLFFKLPKEKQAPSPKIANDVLQANII